jgi:hypothetical protein
MGRHAGTLTAEHRATLRRKACRVWADPVTRAERIEALRKIGDDDRAAIVSACLALPRQPYKQIAHDFDISQSAVGDILRAAGHRRERPYRRSKLGQPRPMMQAAE